LKNLIHFRNIWRPVIAVVVLLAALVSTTATLAQQQTYTVQAGDTLFRIAVRYGVSVDQLAFTNGITNPDRILVGQVLTIPGGTGGPSGRTYTVKAGDTLFSIARAYGTTVSTLTNLNGIANADRILVGQVLDLPGSSSGPIDGGSGGPTDTYVVRPGDSLSRIAVRFNTSVAQLVALNNIANPNLILIGQELTLPTSGSGDDGGTDGDDDGGADGGDDGGGTDGGDDGGADGGDGEDASTITDLIVASDDFDALEQAVIAAGLDDDLAADGDMTVFAPTDDAFAALPEGTLDDLPEGLLADLLLYHVTSGALDSGTVAGVESIEMLNGDTVTVTVEDGDVFLNDTVKIEATDIEASNGVIHVIDAVLLPPDDGDTE